MYMTTAMTRVFFSPLPISEEVLDMRLEREYHLLFKPPSDLKWDDQHFEEMIITSARLLFKDYITLYKAFSKDHIDCTLAYKQTAILENSWLEFINSYCLRGALREWREAYEE
jgi:hypothetical protein